jgi:hypothetical protein
VCGKWSSLEPGLGLVIPTKSIVYCSFYYLFDTSHFFFLLRKKPPMTKIPNKPKTTGKVSPLEKFPISKTAAITIKIIPTNSAIFWNIILHMLISTRTPYRLSLERLSLLQIGSLGLFYRARLTTCPRFFSYVSLLFNFLFTAKGFHAMAEVTFCKLLLFYPRIQTVTHLNKRSPQLFHIFT